MVHLPLGGRSTEVTDPQMKESVEAPEAQQHYEDGLPPPETLHK